MTKRELYEIEKIFILIDFLKEEKFKKARKRDIEFIDNQIKIKMEWLGEIYV